jgi:hypothetical protein
MRDEGEGIGVRDQGCGMRVDGIWYSVWGKRFRIWDGHHCGVGSGVWDVGRKVRGVGLRT